MWQTEENNATTPGVHELLVTVYTNINNRQTNRNQNQITHDNYKNPSFLRTNIIKCNTVMPMLHQNHHVHAYVQRQNVHVYLETTCTCMHVWP